MGGESGSESAEVLNRVLSQFSGRERHGRSRLYLLKADFGLDFAAPQGIVTCPLHLLKFECITPVRTS
jgi:hypothetical protein